MIRNLFITKIGTKHFKCFNNIKINSQALTIFPEFSSAPNRNMASPRKSMRKIHQLTECTLVKYGGGGMKPDFF